MPSPTLLRGVALPFVFTFFDFFLPRPETFAEYVGYIIYIHTDCDPATVNLMNQRLSSLRAKLLQAQQLLPSLLEACLGREPLLPGTLYTLRRKCGKLSCRCTRGELHESTILSYRGSGRPRNLSPSLEDLASLRRLTEPYRRCRKARAQLVRWQRQLLQLVDALAAARIQLGEAEFHQLSVAQACQPRASKSKHRS